MGYGILNKDARGNVTAVDYGVVLTPKEEHPQMAKIGVWIEVAKNRVQRVRSFGKDGNDVVITIQSLQAPAQELTDDFFRFDTEAHPDVEVVDLR